MSIERTTKKRIAICFHEATLDSVPCLMSFITLLAEKQFHIDIFCLQNNSCNPPKFNHDNINLYLQQSNYQHANKIFKSQTFSRIYHVFKFVNFIFFKSLDKKYNYYCGVEQNGLLASFLLSKFRKIPTIYFSLEIYLDSEISQNIQTKLFGFLEKIANRRVSATIIQDMDRAKILAKENQIDINKIYTIPNSPIGDAKSRKRFFLHDRFKIDRNKVLLLYAGTLSEWAYTTELAKATRNLRERYIVVFQSRYNIKGKPYVEELLKNSGQEKAIFSLEPLPYSKLNELYSSADIGLAFYNTKILGTNCQEMGLSSGKIANYLFLGKPVIVNSETSLAQLVKKYGCGIVVNDFQELNNACEQIMENYKKYSDNACLCFNNLFNLENNFNHFYREILNSDR